MPNPRLELALDLIQASDWRLFERLASEFAVVEFPNLRTKASPGGDGGRDGEVFVIESEPTIAFQYSVTVDWDSKVRATISRLKSTFPQVKRLIYWSNKEIGAKADSLVSTVWSSDHVQIDIRDRSWFVERELTSPQRSAASAEIISLLVEPMLKSRGITNKVAQALSDEEGRLALLHLTLDNRDADDRNLTKSCFEALVLSVLHDTSAENTVTLTMVAEQVERIVPHGATGQVKSLVTSALKRLTAKGGPVKHRRQEDSYHLAFSESEKIKDQAADYLLGEEALERDLAAGLWGLKESLDNSPAKTDEESKNLRKYLEIVLMKRGESFASVVNEGGEFLLDSSRITADLHEAGYSGRLSTAQAGSAILRVLAGPSETTTVHLRRLVDAYTLFAFLRLTPDVQKTMLKVFSEGDIWLDTSAVLPLLGELLLDDYEARRFTTLLTATRNAGINLYVTDGVIEEIAAHLNRCVSAANWQGREAPTLPFIYATYVLSGRDIAEFSSWLQDIRGSIRPIDDIREFLKFTFGIERKSLKELADSADLELRGAVQELWYEAHDRRRQGSENYTDPGTVAKLVAHDVENTVGVIEARRVEPSSPMGYRTWWLTLDRTALRLRDYLRDKLGDQAPASPALSPDFLAQLLHLGPLRSRLERGTMPVASDLGRFENVPKELLELAKETRAKFAGMSELRIRREVRDTLDSVRVQVGAEALAGARGVEERLGQQLGRNISER